MIAAPTPVRLRTVLCTHGGLPGALVLERLLRCEHVHVTGVVRSSRVLKPRYGLLRGAWAQWRLSGARYTLYLWASTTLADRMLDWQSTGSVARQAAARCIPMLTTRDINAPEGIDFLRSAAPDIVVTAFFNQRLGLQALGIARVASVNLHPSLLPHERGVDPVFYARLRRQTRLGATVHHLAPELDSGSILSQAEVALDPDLDVMRSTAALYARGAELLIDVLPAIAAGDPGQRQSPGGRYDSWPTRAQVRAFRRAGHRLWGVAGGAIVNPRPRPAVTRPVRPP